METPTTFNIQGQSIEEIAMAAFSKGNGSAPTFTGKGKKLYFWVVIPDSQEGEWNDTGAARSQPLELMSGLVTTEEGEFSDGVLQGAGKRIQNYGEIEEGSFENGMLSGQGKKTEEDGTILEGNFDGGVLEGPGTKTTPDGLVHHGEFKYGEFIEKWAINGCYC